MRVLLYNELDCSGLKTKIDKSIQFLKQGDFTAAQVKKLRPGCYYRAKLDEANRLIFRFGRHADQPVILVLEVIRNHRYEQSRFLRGHAAVSEDDFSMAEAPEQFEMKVIPEEAGEFRLLDKILCFDGSQLELLHHPLPLVVIGSAGSGKTALILERMKNIEGEILYLSLSSYLVENCRKIYFSHGYANERQTIDFLSLNDLIGTIAIPASRELSFQQFDGWVKPFLSRLKDTGAYQVFEEFRGVISGSSEAVAFLSRPEYLGLGPKQSLFSAAERSTIYDIFESYRSFLSRGGHHDPNLLAFSYLDQASPRYDAVVIDEVQDFTSVQIALAMRLLRKRGEFIFCGDSNQIVHPNFFSWAKIKSMFYESGVAEGRDILRVMTVNYRCAPPVTELANRLLRIKNARFGSIDRESHYLIEPSPGLDGEVQLLQPDARLLGEMNSKTRLSTRHAVVVLDDREKEEAGKLFQTPLVFSVREAKGLEYENIVLYCPISRHRQAFSEIAAGLDSTRLEDQYTYSRGKDKSDRTGEAFKFYINGLYVGLTRAMKKVYWIESDLNHPLLGLLELRESSGNMNLSESKSSLEEWQAEARRLEQQGRTEQAESIRRTILNHEPVPWAVLNSGLLDQWLKTALDKNSVNKEAQRKLFTLALNQRASFTLESLEGARFGLAGEAPEKGRVFVRDRYYKAWYEPGSNILKSLIRRHGVDFRNEFGETPLMIAAREGRVEIVKYLLEAGADINARSFFGLMPIGIFLLEIYDGRDYGDALAVELFELLAPPSLTVASQGKLIKLDRRLIEYFLLLAAPSLMVLESQEMNFMSECPLNAPVLEQYLSRLPLAIFPEKRRKRAYLSAALSRNEIHKDGPYNRQLWLRLRLGHYLPSPGLKWPHGEGWLDYYEALPLNESLKLASPYLRTDSVELMEFTKFRLLAKSERSNRQDANRDEAMHP